jgi:hypothetical protein
MSLEIVIVERVGEPASVVAVNKGSLVMGRKDAFGRFFPVDVREGD